MVPTRSINSQEDLLSIADALERESADRYRHLAEELRDQGETLVAAEFAALAEIEEQHIVKVAARGTTGDAQSKRSALADWRSAPVFREDEARDAQVSVPSAGFRRSQ